MKKKTDNKFFVKIKKRKLFGIKRRPKKPYLKDFRNQSELFPLAKWRNVFAALPCIACMWFTSWDGLSRSQ